ncbi:MAG: glycoside hydrolase family 2 protein [Clostridiales bacterium]|nr:glycoside hydrolase family 2 protein [Clostridiales bacterium]
MLRKQPLNFNWKYTPDFKEVYINSSFDDTSFTTVQLPHSNIETPYNNFDEKIYQFESCYRKKIWIDSIASDERVLIHFEGVMTYAKVYLNGQYLGDHKGGYTAFKIDLTEAAKFDADNELVVYVDSQERNDIPPFGFVVDYLTYGGIYREVSLEYRHNIHFESIAVKTNDIIKNSEMSIDLYVHNQLKIKDHLTCICDLKLNNQSHHQFSLDFTLMGEHKESLTISESLKDIKLWDLDNPTLYTLEVTLLRNGKLLDHHEIRIGFREVEFRKDGFYLNREKIKIRGLNRHQSFPYVGYAMPKSAQYKDADLLKYDLALNTVRLSHYPQSKHFLDRCDEIGLLVFDEIPGWQHIGDEAWQDVALQNVKEMILTDINHPSVIIWGVRINESQDDDCFYEKTHQLAKSLDDSRQTGGVRCIRDSHLIEDVYTYNDFVHTGKNQGLDKKKAVIKSEKPYLVTEYNGHMFPTKKFDNESHRVEHALRHLNVMEASAADDLISGAIGWCMFDYNTHKDFGSGDKICYHGVMDMFRIPKYAAYTYASQQHDTPVMHIASSINIGEYEASLLQDICIFTNCDYVELYKNNTHINTFRPNYEKYPHLLHPPIIVDDFVGSAIMDNENFSKNDALIVKNLLASVSKNGTNLKFTDKLKMAWIFLKYKMNTRDAEDLYTKYFGGWGGSATDYVFKGYKDGECVTEVQKSQVFNPELKVSVDSSELIEDITYDTTRVVLELVDEYDQSIIYAHDAIRLSCEGPIEIIGPKMISLIGGSIGFWIKTSGETGTANLHIHSERFKTITKEIKVTKLI